MPLSYVIDKQRRVVVSTGTGIVTFAEIRAHQDALTSDPAFVPQFNQILNFTAATDLDISTPEARVVASRKLFSPQSRRAFVASQAAIFGMGRMLQAYHELSKAASQPAVFGDLAAAEKWLGL
jgi:hypothetical protein